MSIIKVLKPAHGKKCVIDFVFKTAVDAGNNPDSVVADNIQYHSARHKEAVLYSSDRR